MLKLGATPTGDGSIVINDREGGQGVTMTIVENKAEGLRAGAVGTYDTEDPLIRSLVAPFIED